MGDEDPSHRTLDGGFEVLGQTTAASKLGECPLHNPPALEHLEAFSRVQALDDLDGPTPESRDGVAQLIARIATVSKHMAQPGMLPFRLQHPLGVTQTPTTQPSSGRL